VRGIALTPTQGLARGIVAEDWITFSREIGVKAARMRESVARLPTGAGASGSYVYSAAVSVARTPSDCMARVTSRYEGVAIPLENA
jgi:hypothetical protein